MKAELHALLMTHSRRLDPNHPGYGNCRCGFIVDLPHEHAAHVTEHIIYELGLHEDTKPTTDASKTHKPSATRNSATTSPTPANTGDTDD